MCRILTPCYTGEAETGAGRLQGGPRGTPSSAAAGPASRAKEATLGMGAHRPSFSPGWVSSEPSVHLL